MSENIMPVASDATGTIQLQKVMNKAVQFDALMENNQRMAIINAEMRETPPPKSEVPDEKPNALIKVEFPDEGGVLTYMENFDQPFQGFPNQTLVERMDAIKKLTKGFKSGFYHKLWKKFDHSKFKNLMMLVTSPIFNIYAKAEIYTCWRYIERYKIKPNKYCVAVREVYRVFSIPLDENEKQKTRELREQIRDVLCMHYEFDNAYRYRGQDVIMELDKVALLEDPIKEMLRLFDILIAREEKQEVKDTWTLTKWMFDYYRYNKDVRNILKNALFELRLDRCALNKYDMPYVKGRDDYKFNLKK